MAFLVCLGACSRTEKPSGKPERLTVNESHRQMIGELEEVRHNAYRETHYFGDHDLLLGLRREAESQSEQTPASVRFETAFRLILLELQQGNVDAALRHGEAALAVFPDSGIKPEVLVSLKLRMAQAYLRMGEDQNCCANPTAETCIFPIRGGGVHAVPEGSRKAIPLLTEVANARYGQIENRLDAAWLLSIAAMTVDEYPQSVPAAFRLSKLSMAGEDATFPVFKNIAPALGLDRFGVLGATIVDDFDGDGRDEVVNSIWDPGVDLAILKRNRDGKFEDFAPQANLKGLRGGFNLRHADFDNDGDLDILVLRGAWLRELGRHPNSLLRNDGVNEAGVVSFTDIGFASGISGVALPTGTAEWADFDLDGDLDLFVGNESKGDCIAPCQLFRNDGADADGVTQFVDIAVAAGVDVRAFVKGVTWGDFNGDRFPDLYVSNYGEPNRLFQNRGDGTFSDVAEVLGVAEPKVAFPAWFWDYDNDGHLDLFVSGYSWHNGPYLFYYQGREFDPRWEGRLYRNDGSGRFENVTREADLLVPMMTMGSNFGDLDNDGYPDIYLGTGNPDFGSTVPNQLLMNQNGKRFVDRTVSSGMGHLQKGHGVALADFDRDGDLDVFEQLGGAYVGDRFYDVVFENPGFGNHWLEVRLKGVTSNSYGIGCRVRAVILEDGVERSVYTWLNSGGSFGSNPLIAHLGLAGADTVARLEVFWPVTGITQSFAGIPADQRIVVTEGVPEWQRQ